nr:hypothetical protein [Tanacetum cinerariifolium]
MTTVNQGMSVEEIEQFISQRVANAIKAIAIYETKTHMARKLMIQTERQEDKIAENARNKKKWEGNHNGSSSQQNKGHKVPRAHTAWLINKKAYAGSIPLCNQCKLHHNGPYTIKCENCKKRHYKSEYPIVKFQKRVDMIHEGAMASKLKTMQDAIEIETKLMNKKISTLVERQAENKRKLDNTIRNNQNQQQPNKRQNTGKAYTAGHEEKKHYRVLQIPILLTTKGALGQGKRLLATNVGIKGTTGVIAQSERTKTMKTKLEVVRYKEFEELIQPFKVWKKRLQETMTEFTLEESLCMFMAEIAKRHNEHSNLIKQVQASTNFALRNLQASIKALEIQVRQISFILHEKLSTSLQSLTEIMLNANDKTISTFVEANIPSICRINASQYVISNLQNKNLFSKSKKMIERSPSCLNDDNWDESKKTDGENDLEAHYTNAKPHGKVLPQKENDPRSFTLPCFINNMCFNKALADLGASVSVMPYSTYTTLGLGNLIPTKLIVELADKIVKQPKGIAKNVLVEARLMGETLVLNRPLDPLYGDYIELNELNVPLELRRDQVDDLMLTIEEGKVTDEPMIDIINTRNNKIFDEYPSFCEFDRKIHIDCAYNLRFSCMIGFDHASANFFLILFVNMMSKEFYNSIIRDKVELKGKNVVGAFMNVPIFVEIFSVVTYFVVVENIDGYQDQDMGDIILEEPFCKASYVEAKRFKHLSNAQCNEIKPLLKVSLHDNLNGISHSYQKLRSFYNGVLNIELEYVRDAKMEEWLTREHISVHEME